jgi:hypothetical protein
VIIEVRDWKTRTFSVKRLNMNELTPLIKFWLVKNISHKPQVLRHPKLKNGILVINPGQQEWIDTTIHSEIADRADWCETITNDVALEQQIAQVETPALPEADIPQILTEPERFVGVKAEIRDAETLETGSEEDSETIVQVVVTNDAATEATSNQCKGIKANGEQCKRTADVGSEYCYLHEPKTEDE